LPQEYADSAFMIGAKYQRTELTIEPGCMPANMGVS